MKKSIGRLSVNASHKVQSSRITEKIEIIDPVLANRFQPE
jgi:hypothetical protein